MESVRLLRVYFGFYFCRVYSTEVKLGLELRGIRCLFRCLRISVGRMEVVLKLVLEILVSRADGI